MRIIGGRLKGVKIEPPKNLPVRPTTDKAKEGLFSILSNSFDIEEISVLDLFSGTGNISLEFASRGAKVSSVDMNHSCCSFLNSMSERYDLNIDIVKQDVFRFLSNKAVKKYDIIFADPPFSLPKVPEIQRLVFDNGWLEQGGNLLIENPSLKNFSNLEGFQNQRIYGHVAFNFFVQS